MFTFGCSECEHRIPELSNYHTRYLCIFVCSGLFWFVLTNYYNVSEFFNEYMVLIYKTWFSPATHWQIWSECHENGIFHFRLHRPTRMLQRCSGSNWCSISHSEDLTSIRRHWSNISASECQAWWVMHRWRERCERMEKTCILFFPKHPNHQ